MHEWALAEAVISTARKIAREQSFNEVMDVNIELGQLQQVETNIFEFALKEMIKSERSLFKHTKIRVQQEKAVLKCRNCDHEWEFEDSMEKLAHERSEAIHFVPETVHAYIHCPECKSSDFDILRGRGVRIDSITGE